MNNEMTPPLIEMVEECVNRAYKQGVYSGREADSDAEYEEEKCRALLSEIRQRDAEREQLIADYEEALADHRRLVRELDVALNGEEGAAKQASLCDIVAQVKRSQRLTALEAEQRVGVVPEDCVVVPKEPSDALLRPFYECPPDELGLAWSAMQRIAGKNATLPTLTPQRLAELQANERRYLFLREAPGHWTVGRWINDDVEQVFLSPTELDEAIDEDLPIFGAHIDAAIDASGREG